MNVGLIGYGYWGKNLFRNFNNSQEFSLIKVADLNTHHLKEVKLSDPTIITTTFSNDILLDESIELVIIATPVRTHYELIKKALLNNKHVLAEKPMTSSYKEAKELCCLAKEKNRHLIIDYTFLYSGAVRKIKEIFSNHGVGSLKSIKSSRLGKGIVRDDVSVFWDLSSHDLSITNFLLNKTPVSVKSEMTSINEDILNEKAVMTVFYPEGIEARFESSWYSAIKERKMAFNTAEETIYYDDTLGSNKIKIINGSYTSFPDYDFEESLSVLVSDISKVLKNEATSLSNCNFAFDIIKVLEAAQYSLENNGELIQLQPELESNILSNSEVVLKD